MSKKIPFLFFFILVGQAHAIINGENCGEDQFPASVALIEGSDGHYGRICGATLIAPDVAITAAHCVEDYFKDKNPSAPSVQYYITSVSDLRNPSFMDSPSTIRVHALVMHEGYVKRNDYRFNEDVALLFLSTQSTLPVAQLVTPNESYLLRTGMPGFIVGWGQKVVAQKGLANTPPTKSCASTFVNNLTSMEIQFGSNAYSARTCFGDSGGAAYVQFEPTRIGAAPPLRLAGITSHTTAYDLDCSKGGVDARIDVHYRWIDNTLRDTCRNGYRLFCDKPGI